MAGTLPLPSTLRARSAERVSAGALSIPWYIWCNLLAVACGVVGGVWDISWHESVGRDTFWTPAHILIQLCGIISGLGCGYLILATTFRKDSPLRTSSVSMWGFRGPLGAFLCAWGAVAMITSAPFDNWWHNAYGLDVKILSPPHILLALGMTGIRFGTLVLILAELNRAVGEYRVRLERVLFLSIMFLFGMTVGIMQEDTFRMFMHGAKFYLVVMLVTLIWYAAASRVSENRWAATIVAGLYTAMHLFFMWVLQLIPAEPKLGPVYQKITHLVPPDFPLLIIVPAIVFDLVRRHLAGSNRLKQAAILGAASLASFFAAQWPFANFLMSPASRNWFFATNNFPYFVPPQSHWGSYAWLPTESSPAQFAFRMFLALLAAILMTAIGLSWGDWMRRLRR
ncbi:MAG TPA: hypothetical protein VKP61_04680 [Candidatus Acidoferrum sp.]|nr:hypothetical protein [Candidatus Acidoferrum sp.]